MACVGECALDPVLEIGLILGDDAPPCRSRRAVGELLVVPDHRPGRGRIRCGQAGDLVVNVRALCQWDEDRACLAQERAQRLGNDNRRGSIGRVDPASARVVVALEGEVHLLDAVALGGRAEGGLGALRGAAVEDAVLGLHGASLPMPPKLPVIGTGATGAEGCRAAGRVLRLGAMQNRQVARVSRVAMLVITALGCRGADDPSGAVLFTRHCASCHGAEGRGDGPAAGALATQPPDLTALRQEVPELMKSIDGSRTLRAHGSAAMPVWGPIFEAEHGEITGRTKIRRKLPVEEYLKRQKRFAHLFGAKPDVARIALIQSMADRNIRKFGLLD